MKYYRAYTKADGEKDYIMDRDGHPLIRSAEDADDALRTFENYTCTNFSNWFAFRDALAECPIYVEEL